jgi:uncharacterized protein
MEFNVAQLLREPVGASRVYEIAGGCTADDGGAIGAQGTVRLLRTDAGILATGTLSSSTSTTCSRCLGAMPVTLALVIEEEYYPIVDVATGAPLRAPVDPSSALIDAHHILDLCEAVRQQRILAEPMQPLCRPNCAGLCPDCGSDLNAGSCRCLETDIDSRWAVLSELAETREL